MSTHQSAPKKKNDILCKLNYGVKAVDLFKQFNLSQPTLSTWKKQRSKLYEMVDTGKVLNTKHNHESFLPQVERALHLWFSEMRSKPHVPPINQILLVQKATLWVFFIVWTLLTCVPFNPLHCIQHTFNSFNITVTRTQFIHVFYFFQIFQHVYNLICYIAYIVLLTPLTSIYTTLYLFHTFSFAKEFGHPDWQGLGLTGMAWWTR